MPVINSVAATLKDEMTAWRRALHENPQIAYEEEFAASLVTQKLTEWGIPFVSGITKTGIVATLEGQRTDSGRVIGLRADIDALPILEKTNQPWSSKIPGRMHACGHDGHTAILLGVAKHLRENDNFNGTVRLIFQPAEETGRGARRMIDDGFFERFPVDMMFGLHNWPHLKAGQIGLRTGALLAAVDEFDIVIQGMGGHAASPHGTVDPILVASHIVTALQSIISRNIDPIEPAVVTVTNISGGNGTFNIIGDTARLTGTVRTFSPEIRTHIKTRLETLVQNIAASFGASATVDYHFITGATINSAEGAALATKAAQQVAGEKNTLTDVAPNTGGEDFGSFLEHRSGAFVFLGQGVDGESPFNHELHSPYYDFNDDVMPLGVSFFAKLVENCLPANTP